MQCVESFHSELHWKYGSSYASSTFAAIDLDRICFHYTEIEDKQDSKTNCKLDKISFSFGVTSLN